MLEQDMQNEEIIARVAALDIGKAELVCCARVIDTMQIDPKVAAHDEHVADYLRPRPLRWGRPAGPVAVLHPL